jgi:hypothetical protein
MKDIIQNINGKIFKTIEYGHTAHNRSVYAAPAVAGLASIRLGQSPTAPSHASLRHIWAARKPTVCFIVPPKRRKQPERYVPFALKFSENIVRNY